MKTTNDITAKPGSYLKALLFIILIALNSSLTLKAQDTLVCPQSGKSNSEKVQQLNMLKNRYMFHKSIYAKVTLDSIFKPGNDADRFNPSMYVSVTGWVVGYADGGPQSCNCYTHNTDDQDLILYVANSLSSWKDSIFIVVITPDYKHSMGIDPDTIFGKRVQISGYMLYDSQNANHALNTCTNCNAVVIKTAWQIHPVVGLRVLPPIPSQPKYAFEY